MMSVSFKKDVVANNALGDPIYSVEFKYLFSFSFNYFQFKSLYFNNYFLVCLE